jgi:hypothetical protein
VSPPRARPRLRARSIGFAVAVGFGWGAAANGLFGAVTLPTHFALDVRSTFPLAALIIGAIALAVALAHRFGPRATRAAAELLVLVALPAWGLAINRALPTCLEEPCGGVFRPLAVPHVYALVAAHGLVALAYLVSRRRPEALRPALELALPSLLAFGALLDLLVAVHLAPLNLAFVAIPTVAIFFPVIGLPLLAPILSVLLFGAELYRRLRRRGEERLLRAADLAPVPRVLLLTPALVGLYAAVHALILGDSLAALQVFTHACAGTFAQLQSPPADCHYLCTVAAQGHPWLVRPERVGRRRGAPILVNRQLAIANAFEDLLHERWPRFGRLARRAYDRLGLPVSRLIRHRAVADTIYLAMKPAEWAFYLVLLLVDRTPPESRISRMYR